MRNPEEPVYCPLCGEKLDFIEGDNDDGGHSWFKIDCACGASGEIAVEIYPKARKDRLAEEAWFARRRLGR